MKKKLLTFSLYFGGCLFCLGQSQVAFHNRGAINSSGESNNQTSLHINGDMKTSGSAAGMILEKSRVKLTGDFLNDVMRGASGGKLFVSPSGSAGVFEFCGTTAQSIKTSGTNNSDTPSKLHNFINFPNIEINNKEHVTLDSRLGAKTADIILTKGWLILDSKVAEANVDGGLEVNPGQESVLAHLLVDGNIDYKESSWNGKPAAERGFIQVNLKIPGESATAKSIVGFGTPFKHMYNDYFMFNTLLEPQYGFHDGSGFLSKAPLTDPKTKMQAGKGYVVGIDLRGGNASDYPELTGYEGVIDFAQRATDGYRFNRHAFADYAPKNQVFGSDPSVDAYQIEKLNTQDVSLAIKAGYNYLANPYTCPLNIDKLLDENNAGSTWNIYSGEWKDGIDMWNRVWVLAPNSIAEPSSSGDVTKSKYTYNYQVAMKTGGTYIDNDNAAGVTSIAPLQMFLIYSRKDMNITIPRSERVMGTTRFLRNAADENKRRDDFILEFRDMQTNTTDRTSIVLRTQEELDESSYTNVERMESTSSESGNNTRSAGGTQADFRQSLASQIYTKEQSGKALSVQFLPVETTDRIILYHIPSSKAQDLNVLGLRLDTKDKITRMWLEDSKYNTEVEITPDMLYQTYSEPNDSHERFALRFSTEATGIEDSNQDNSAIYAFSQNGDVVVAGLGDKDMGSMLSLYDINGRLIAQKQADDQKVLLYESCPVGVYVVKVHSLETKTFKLIVRQ